MHLYFSQVLILSFALLFSHTANANCPADKVIEGKHLVVTKSEVSVVSSLSLKAQNGVNNWKKISSKKKNTINSFSTSSIQKTSSPQETIYSVEGMRKEDLEKLDYVKSVQSDCVVELNSTNDSFANFQNWYLSQINYSTNTLTPKREIVVAITDTGVDIDHEDIRDNLWINSVEANGRAGVDDDNNGRIDDIYGYDVADNDNDPRPSLSRDTDHGTHVAGLAGAVSNNSLGIAGVSNNTIKIMAVKGFKSNRSSSLSDLLETIYYAVDNGADIINASWGVEKLPQGAEQAAVNYAVENGVVIVAAAGNSSVPASWVVPANLRNVITVGSVNSQNQLSTFSNYEDDQNVVDFVAPGGDGSQRRNEALLSTGYNDAYVSLRGTSMSAPLVAGSIGLLMSQSESLTAYQAVFVLSNTADNLSLSPYLQTNKTHLYQRINIDRALDYLAENESEVPTIEPEIEPVTGFESRELASSSGSGGCSGGSLTANSNSDKAKLPAIFLIMFPLLFTIACRRKLNGK